MIALDLSMHCKMHFFYCSKCGLVYLLPSFNFFICMFMFCFQVLKKSWFVWVKKLEAIEDEEMSELTLFAREHYQ